MSIAHPPQSSPKKGIVYMVLAMLVFSILNAIIKDATQAYHPIQLVFVRCLFAVIPCGLVLLWTKQWNMPDEGHWKSHGIRAIFLAVALSVLFYGVGKLPLSNSMALYFASSIFIVLLSYPILNEKIKPFQWGVVLIGFMGILIIANPTSDVFNMAAVFVVMGAFFESCYNLVGRRISRFHSSLMLTFWGSLLPAVLVAIPLFFVWETPDVGGWIALISLGLGGGIGQLLVTSAYTHAPGGAVAPMIYTAIIWSTLLDVVLYQNFPGLSFWLGCAIIVGAGLYNVHREMTISRKAVITS